MLSAAWSSAYSIDWCNYCLSIRVDVVLFVVSSLPSSVLVMSDHVLVILLSDVTLIARLPRSRITGTVITLTR